MVSQDSFYNSSAKLTEGCSWYNVLPFNRAFVTSVKYNASKCGIKERILESMKGCFIIKEKWKMTLVEMIRKWIEQLGT